MKSSVMIYMVSARWTGSSAIIFLHVYVKQSSVDKVLYVDIHSILIFDIGFVLYMASL